MTEKELWKAFIKDNNLADCEYEAWAFGVDADLLAHLVMIGEKTATASAYPLYELEKESLPTVGEYSVILDEKDNAVCVIQTQKVTVVPFCEVTAEHAYKEGEGDKSLAYWREVHEKFFTECLNEAGQKFTPDMKVVCEEFTVVYKPAGSTCVCGGLRMLQTERLYLRNFTPADAQMLFAYRNDGRCNRYQRYEDTSLEYLQWFVRDYARSAFASKEEEQHYAICRADGEMIGDLSVFFTEADNCFTLGITIAPTFQRQGYAYELLYEVVARLQEQYPPMDIVALIEKENKGSIALFKKLGFIEECYAESIQSYVFTIYGKN